MRKIYLSAIVDPDLCKGDKICENICVAKAVKVDNRKAVVDENRCVSCEKCMDACPEGAITMVPKKEPMLLTTNPDEVDRHELEQLCERAHLDPAEFICGCTLTTAKEAAAAILKGAKTPEEVTLKTGIRSACGMWCMAPILRLLNAQGIELPQSDNYRWYNIKANLWDTSEEAARKYPEYRLKEDKKLCQ
ncbi:MAG: 4Fe-4S binding protein, partial [Candidatus Hodarchaeales archaeon]